MVDIVVDTTARGSVVQVELGTGSPSLFEDEIKERTPSNGECHLLAIVQRMQT